MESSRYGFQLHWAVRVRLCFLFSILKHLLCLARQALIALPQPCVHAPFMVYAIHVSLTLPRGITFAFYSFA